MITAYWLCNLSEWNLLQANGTSGVICFVSRAHLTTLRFCITPMLTLVSKKPLCWPSLQRKVNGHLLDQKEGNEVFETFLILNSVILQINLKRKGIDAWLLEARYGRPSN